ncbi:MAG TPA: ABC transporter ATP-binding protein [Chloroflexota bacterium]
MSAGDGLVVEGLVVGYGGVVAVDGLSLRVRPGEIVALIGANGAGKTSTLNAISGLVRPRAGSIQWNGRELSGRPPHRVVEAGVVQVPEGRAILVGLTVRENLLLGAFQRRDRAAVARDLEALLARFPILRERGGALAGALSGGEQQMLALARGLIAGPRLLMLDEPSMGLAPQIVREIFRIIGGLRDEGRTILLVEQNARQALALADHAFVLQTGRLAMAGTAAELASDPRVAAAYLGGSVVAGQPAQDQP